MIIMLSITIIVMTILKRMVIENDCDDFEEHGDNDKVGNDCDDGL